MRLGTEMKRMLVSIARDKGIRLIELELVADHAHLLVEVDQRQNLPDVIKQLKGASARFIFLKYPELKIDMKSDSFWQKGIRSTVGAARSNRSGQTLHTHSGRQAVPPRQLAEGFNPQRLNLPKFP